MIMILRKICLLAIIAIASMYIGQLQYSGVPIGIRVSKLLYSAPTFDITKDTSARISTHTEKFKKEIPLFLGNIRKKMALWIYPSVPEVNQTQRN